MPHTATPQPRSEKSAADFVAQAIVCENVAESLALLRAAAALLEGEDTALSARIDGLIGYMLYRGGDLGEARSYFEASERRWANIPAEDSAKWRAATLCNYANLLCDLGAYQASRTRLEATLDIERNLYGADDPEYARTLGNFARLLRITGLAEEACHYARQALVVLESSKAPRDRADALYSKNLLGLASMDSGRWSEALALFKSLLLPAKRAAPEIYYSALNNVGWALYGMGDYEQAAAWEKRAIRIVRKHHGDAARVAEVTLLTNLAAGQHKRGDFKRACRRYDEARAVLERVVPDGRHPQMASIRCNWGTALYRLRRFAEARNQYEQALALRLEIDGESHQTTADVRFHLAGLTLAEGATDDALTQAIAILALPGLHSNPDGVWRVFNLMSLALEAQGYRRTAILFGKQAVEILETMRLSVLDLGQRAEGLFTFSRATGYRTLADMLVSENRLAEAEYVLARLRAAEQDDFLGRDSGVARSGHPGLSQQEEEWCDKYRVPLNRIAQLRKQLNEFVEAGDDADLTAVRRNIASASNELAAMVSAVVQDLRQTEPPRTDNDPSMADHLGPPLRLNDIFLHFFPANSHLWVLRRDGKGNAISKKLETDEATLANLILDLRHAVSTPSAPLDKVKVISLRLYDLLLRPVLEDEPPQDARLSLWLDGALRFMPPAVLFDGKHYLAEKIAISLYSPFAGLSAPRRSLNKNGVAGFAAGRQIEGFAPLPFAVKEIETVVNDLQGGGLFSGERFLDERFTPDNLRRAAGQFGGLLIASHFILRPADLTRSGLLMGTGELMPVREIAGLDFTGLSLVTISGCDTGTAGIDGDAALLQSMADRLALRGAGAVLASLWRVADAGSARLVTEFYANLAGGGSSNFALALAQAQRMMAQGDKSSALHIGAAMRGIGQQSNETDDNLANTDFRHPYYWAPFVLLGEGCAQ
jgi:CHAT domain-containing protein/tetratricopeptide (TPR) repeat protein